MAISSDIKEEYNVLQLVKDAENENIFIPEFQRHFIWDRSQIKLLIDSLYRKYTINSILIWNGGDELARRRVGGSLKEIKFPNSDKGEKISYILDGQQRTTALMLVFTDKNIYKGKNVRKKERATLYFNQKCNDDDPEKLFIFDDEIILIDNNEIMLKKFTEEEIFKKFEGRFVNLKHIYYYKDPVKAGEIQTKVADYFEKNLEKTINYIEMLNKLGDRILSRRIYLIFQPGKLDEVLDIFERINTQNTKLNIHDIMVAKTYKLMEEDDHQFYFNLRNYLKFICSSDVTNKYLLNEERIDPDRIDLLVDEATLLFLIMIILRRQFVQKEILRISTEELYINIKNVGRILQKAAQEMEVFNVKANRLRDYVPIFKFIVAYVAENEKKLNNPNTKEFIKFWFWNTLLYNRYPGAQNERIKADYDNLSADKLNESKKDIVKDRTKKYNFNELIDGYYDRKREQIYLAIATLFLNNDPQDFYSGIQLRSTTKSLEHHHIFPVNSKFGRVYCETYKNDPEKVNLINNVANIALLTDATNNEIRHKDPKDYISSLEGEYKKVGKEQQFYRVMKSQLISKEMIEFLKKNDFDNFVLQRTKLIVGKINELCE